MRVETMSVDAIMEVIEWILGREVRMTAREVE